MANVAVKVTGGSLQEKSANTVGELKTQLGLGANYQATINGDPAEDGDQLEEHNRVDFALATKGGI